jgi:uncharacterized protein involved in outer membrane biogenesis
VTRPQQLLLLAGALVVLAGAALLVTEHHLQGYLLRTFTAQTGRPIRVSGEFEVHLLSRHPRLTATKVAIDNPPWMPAGVTAEVGRLALSLQWQFSTHPLQIRRLELDQAKLHLVREADGRANWQASPDGPGAGPPLIRSLSMPEARVELHDERRHLQFEGTVSAGDASEEGQSPPLRIDGAGQLNGRAVAFMIRGEPLALAWSDRPYHFSLEEHSGATHLAGRGFLEQPFDFRRLQGSFTAGGPDLKDLYYVVGLRLPDSGPFRASGKLVRQDMRFAYSDLAVTSGESDLRGALTVEGSRKRIRIEGELTAELLRLADLGARAAGRAAPPEPAPALRLPDTPLRVSGLRRMEALVKVRLRALELGPETLSSVTGEVALQRGVLSIEKVKATLGDGSLAGEVRFDAARETPRGDLSLSLTGLPLDQLSSKDGSASSMDGTLSARVQLGGSGKSLHELAASANGTATAVVPHGAMRASVAQAASLDLSGALGLLLKSHKETEVRCGVASFDAHDGVLSLRTFLVDTDEALITAAGEVHMDTEALDLTLRGRPKKPQLALHGAVAVGGTLRHPQVRLVGGEVAAQAGAAAALGVLLTPLAALLAFVNPGLQRDADCAALLAQADVPAAAGD